MTRPTCATSAPRLLILDEPSGEIVSIETLKGAVLCVDGLTPVETLKGEPVFSSTNFADWERYRALFMSEAVTG